MFIKFPRTGVFFSLHFFPSSGVVGYIRFENVFPAWFKLRCLHEETSPKEKTCRREHADALHNARCDRHFQQAHQGSKIQ